jgi:hypothetical protein
MSREGVYVRLLCRDAKRLRRSRAEEQLVFGSPSFGVSRCSVFGVVAERTERMPEQQQQQDDDVDDVSLLVDDGSEVLTVVFCSRRCAVSGACTVGSMVQVLGALTGSGTLRASAVTDVTADALSEAVCLQETLRCYRAYFPALFASSDSQPSSSSSSAVIEPSLSPILRKRALPSQDPTPRSADPQLARRVVAALAAAGSAGLSLEAVALRCGEGRQTVLAVLQDLTFNGECYERQGNYIAL